jgi:hypothetical protein
MADLDGALKRWAADREALLDDRFASTNEISDVNLIFDEGWAGTDVTPGDPAEFRVAYTVSRRVTITIPGKELAQFIRELVERA